MGLLDKVKNLFTEEVEEPIERKEPKKREQKKEIKKEQPKIEPRREIQKQEKTIEIAPARKETALLYEKDIFDEPEVKEEKPLSLYFSDDDFNDLTPRRKEKPVVKEFYREKKKEEKVEEKKYFKPSPIISPVYGILDKNYKKDDISTKNIERNNDNSNLTIDDIRNKAYGTLEDELENNLIKEEKVETKESAIDIFDELQEKELTKEIEKVEDKHEEIEKEELSKEIARQKQQIEEINEKLKNNVHPDKEHITSRKIDNILEELDEIEELIPDKSKEEKPEMNTNEETENNNDENIEESDLLNLIDSMYEKRDE